MMRTCSVLPIFLLRPSMNWPTHQKSLWMLYSKCSSVHTLQWNSLQTNPVDPHHEPMLKTARVFSSPSYQILIQYTGCPFYVKKPGRALPSSTQKVALKEIFETRASFSVSTIEQFSSPSFVCEEPRVPESFIFIWPEPAFWNAVIRVKHGFENLCDACAKFYGKI